MKLKKRKCIINIWTKKNLGKNDTEIKYINNDKEEISESNERDLDNKYTQDKLINLNDDLGKYFKIVDSLDNEEEEYDN